MNTYAITGKDTLIINDRVFTDLADGDASTIAFPNDLITMKTGKDGNTLYASNKTGENVDAVLRVVKGSSDDKFLNSLYNSMKADLPAFSLLEGSFVKKIGDGQGNVTSDSYDMAAGIFKRGVDSKDNVEGDTEQAVSVWTLGFARANRSL